MVHSVAAAVTISITGLVGSAAPAQAYQVDCAILLCLAGGWPASAPCAHARAVFIRRITPWPIEPPLQIWRCPMGASFNESTPLSPMKRLDDIVFRDQPLIQQETAPLPLVRVQADDQADIDISGDAFSFVRSIRIYHIQFSQRQIPDGDCDRSDSTRLGSYRLQGDYHWTRSNVAQVPAASQLTIPNGCESYVFRSVFVDWRDHAGNYDSEEVHY
ncbi:hypothetical protein [Thalassovita taeanensis]